MHLSFSIPRQGLDLPALFAAIEGRGRGGDAGELEWAYRGRTRGRKKSVVWWEGGPAVYYAAGPAAGSSGTHWPMGSWIRGARLGVHLNSQRGGAMCETSSCASSVLRMGPVTLGRGYMKCTVAHEAFLLHVRLQMARSRWALRSIRSARLRWSRSSSPWHQAALRGIELNQIGVRFRVLATSDALCTRIREQQRLKLWAPLQQRPLEAVK